MPSFFQDLPNLHTLDPKNILLHLSGKFNLGQIENYLANKVLYPQIVPITQTDLVIEIAILKEVVRLDPTRFYNNQSHRIFVYPELLTLFPNPLHLVYLVLDVVRPLAMTTVTLKGEISRDIGTYIKPQIKNPKGVVNIELREKNVVTGKVFPLQIGSITPIPALFDKADITFSSNDATLFSSNKIDLEVAGGEIGIIVDTRL